MENLIKFIKINEVIKPLIIIVSLFIVYIILAKIIKRVFEIKNRRISVKKQNTLSNFLTNILRYVLIIIGIIMILNVYNVNTTSIIASLGVVSVILGLALQDMVKDFIAGVSLVLEDTYNVGDWVTINNFKGEVIYLGMKTTKLKSYNNDIYTINNGSITCAINHSINNSLVVVDIDVAYDTDIEKLEKLLDKLCLQFEKLDNIKGEVKVLGIENLAESSIVYRITTYAEETKKYQIQREIKKIIKLEFDKNNITIPYKQVVVRSE